MQAVQARREGLYAAHFWQAGAIAGITLDGPGTVLVQRRGQQTAIAVADPGRTATTLTLGLPWTVRSVTTADDTITVTTGRRPTLTIDVAGSHGHTHSAVLI